MDPAILIFLALFAGMMFWVLSLVRKLEQRLRSLERQHLALVAEIEDRLYRE